MKWLRDGRCTALRCSTCGLPRRYFGLLDDTAMGIIAPKGIYPGITTTAEPVEIVADRVLVVIILMVLLCRIKLRCRFDQGRDFLAQLIRDFGAGCFGLRLLFCVQCVDRRGVTLSPVTELPIRIGGIDTAPEHIIAS